MCFMFAIPTTCKTLLAVIRSQLDFIVKLVESRKIVQFVD